MKVQIFCIASVRFDGYSLYTSRNQGWGLSKVFFITVIFAISEFVVASTFSSSRDDNLTGTTKGLVVNKISRYPRRL